MRIALLAPGEESVPPSKYGGTELIVSNLAETLVARGHEVYLLASGDSQTKAKLVPVFFESIRKYPGAQNPLERETMKFMGLGRTIIELQKLKVDIVHNHIGWRYLPFASLYKAPTVTTLHGPLDVKYQQLVYGTYKDAAYVSISNSQREPFPDLNFAATVYNGIEVEKFEFEEKPGEYLAFLGRMSPEKGPIDAIKIAKAAGKKLIMAAKVDSVDVEYFTKKVKPLIDGKQIKFIGEVDHVGKVKLLKNALGLIAPINWREPFGLFLVEAMACGTPVLTRPMGAAPELILNEKTGFVYRTNRELIAAVKHLGSISRTACRKRVEDFFSAKRMTEGYEMVYRSLLERKSS
ncbi:MAG: glycosyltransferase family 4 protein [bacterium]|nr:glycosyltransferase family 4 protein [bacterium]